ncbi:MAG: hypothetical protein KGL39_20720 [Patescibacteria group bacterium]|nr:hypothetical protein [Patescibacteria group bacterium]
MGRELKRVPLDFDWPLHKTWEGYVNPHYKKCPDCTDGYTVARRYVHALVQLIMIAGEDSLRGRKHPWLQNAGLCPVEPPTPDMAELTSGLAGREPSPLGHDSCDNWRAEAKIIAAAGLDPKVWGICPTCEGDAIDPAFKAAYEAWQAYEPPTGDGYQLWDTTGDGSPITPVFASLDALCKYASVNCTTFADYKASAAEWRRMLSEGQVYHQEGNNIFI